MIHLQLAHSIDLRPLTTLNAVGKRQVSESNAANVISEASTKHNDFDCVVIDDEDYYSCDSLILDSEKGSVAWNDESDLDVESNYINISPLIYVAELLIKKLFLQVYVMSRLDAPTATAFLSIS